MTNESTEVVATIVEGGPLEVTPSHRAPSRVTGGIGHLEEYMMLAERVSRTAMVPTAFRNKPDEVLAVVLYGAELSIGPMQALQQINFIEGKPSVSPELMRALIRQAGHRLNITSTKTECVIVGERCDTGEVGESEFTLVDAVAAGLCRIVDGTVQSRSRDGKALPWEKYTKDMLLARATSRIARMMFSDVIAGMSYTAEEIESYSPPGSMRSVPTIRDTAPTEETGELATESQMYALTTSLNLLDAVDQATVKAKWIDANLPPIARGLTQHQADDAIQLVCDVLNTHGDDVVGGNVTDPATTTQVRALNTLFSKREVIGPGRHDLTSEIIGRHIASLNDLTKSEATLVIDRLKGSNQHPPSSDATPDRE